MNSLISQLKSTGELYKYRVKQYRDCPTSINGKLLSNVEKKLEDLRTRVHKYCFSNITKVTYSLNGEKYIQEFTCNKEEAVQYIKDTIPDIRKIKLEILETEEREPISIKFPL